MRSYRLAIVGATGAVGHEMLKVLERRRFPLSVLRLFASERSVGTHLSFQGQDLAVELLTANSFADTDVALFSAGAPRSLEFAPGAVKAGAVVVDNSSAFRMDENVPLVVPEINPGAMQSHQGIIANPNCSTIQLVMALQPIRDLFGLQQVTVATYQSVSGAGQRSIQELEAASLAVLQGHDEPQDLFPRGIAFNCVPHIDVMNAEGHTKEEIKMRDETRKILNDDSLPVYATCVRVPVFRCHSEAVWVQTKQDVDRDAVIQALGRTPGVVVATQHEDFPVARDAAGRDEVYVGRIRTFEDDRCKLAMWIVSDNLVKGAALNAVQIAEKLCASKALR